MGEKGGVMDQRNHELLDSAARNLGNALAALVRVRGPQAGCCARIRTRVRNARDLVIDLLEPAPPAESKST